MKKLAIKEVLTRWGFETSGKDSARRAMLKVLKRDKGRLDIVDCLTLAEILHASLAQAAKREM